MMQYAFDWPFIFRVLPRFGSAVGVTLALFVTSLLISSTGAIVLALLSRTKGRVIHFCLGTFSWLFRGLPELIVLLFAYLALPRMGLPLPSFWAAVLGLALIGMAYEYEIFRGALEAVPSGQFEAARALGMSRARMAQRIVMPQVFRIAIAPYITFACSALKRTSIASAISVPEIMGLSERFNEAFQKPFELMLVAMVFYVALSSMLMCAEWCVERWLNHDRAVAPHRPAAVTPAAPTGVPE